MCNLKYKCIFCSDYKIQNINVFWIKSRIDSFNIFESKG